MISIRSGRNGWMRNSFCFSSLEDIAHTQLHQLMGQDDEQGNYNGFAGGVSH